MPETMVHAVVSRKGYTFRGNSIDKGRVVRMTAAQFQSSQSVQPSFFRTATPEEVKAAGTVIDLAQVKPAAAANVADAEAALEANAAPKRGK